MAVQHRTVTVGTTATDLTSEVRDALGYEDVARSMSIQNESGVTVYIGGPGVTATDYGYALPASSEVAFDLRRSDVLFAAVAAGTAPIRVLHTGV
jgi:hypothetical protein